MIGIYERESKRTEGPSEGNSDKPVFEAMAWGVAALSAGVIRKATLGETIYSLSRCSSSPDESCLSRRHQVSGQRLRFRSPFGDRWLVFQVEKKPYPTTSPLQSKLYADYGDSTIVDAFS